MLYYKEEQRAEYGLKEEINQQIHIYCIIVLYQCIHVSNYVYCDQKVKFILYYQCRRISVYSVTILEYLLLFTVWTPILIIAIIGQLNIHVGQVCWYRPTCYCFDCIFFFLIAMLHLVDYMSPCHPDNTATVNNKYLYDHDEVTQLYYFASLVNVMIFVCLFRLRLIFITTVTKICVLYV